MKVISASARLPSPPGLLLLGPIMLSCSLAAEIRPIFHQLRRLTVHGCCTLSHTRRCSPQLALTTTWLLSGCPSHYIKICRLVTQVSIFCLYFAIPIACVLSKGRRWRGGGGHLPSAVTMELGWTRGWRLIER